MEDNNDITTHSATISEVPESDVQREESTPQLNEIKEQITKLENDNTENQIREEQTESDNFQTLFQTLEETNESLGVLNDRLDLTNHIIVGQFFIIGVLTGIVLFRILFDRLKV